MRKLFRLRNTQKKQLPRIQGLLAGYSNLSQDDIYSRINEIYSLSTKLRVARSLLEPSDREVCIDHNKHTSRAEQELVLGSENKMASFYNAEILEARYHLLRALSHGLEEIAKKDKEKTCSSVLELGKALGEVLEKIKYESSQLKSFLKHTIILLAVGTGCATAGFMASAMAGTAVALGVAATIGFFTQRYLKARADRMAQLGTFFSKDFESELKELSKGFVARYEVASKAVDKNIEKCRHNLEELINELLLQAPENKREDVERTLELSAKNL